MVHLLWSLPFTLTLYVPSLSQDPEDRAESGTLLFPKKTNLKSESIGSSPRSSQDLSVSVVNGPHSDPWESPPSLSSHGLK